jgi:hypothetical protein
VYKGVVWVGASTAVVSGAMLVAEELDVEDEELDFDVEVAEEDAELLLALVLVLEA